MTNLSTAPKGAIHHVDFGKGPSSISEEWVSEAWLAGKSDTTRRSYLSVLASFGEFQGWGGSPEHAACVLLASGKAGAMEAITRWLGHLKDTSKKGELAAKTAAYRQAVIRSLLNAAWNGERVDWRLDMADLVKRHGIRSVDAKAYRDTTGPTVDQIRALCEAARNLKNPLRAARDFALLRIAFECALRRAELVGLNVGHVDFHGGERATVSVLGKGRTDRETRPLTPAAAEALGRYLEMRGNPGPEAPLFARIKTKAHEEGRLTRDGLHHVVKDLGKRIGIKLWPHALRHSSITAYLDLSNGDVRGAQKHSRHANPETLMIYDDNRRDPARRAAELLAGALDD